jgi:hypothetical protein
MRKLKLLKNTIALIIYSTIITISTTGNSTSNDNKKSIDNSQPKAKYAYTIVFFV